MKSQI